MTTLYGLRNCDTVRRARRWLDDNGIAHGFHDYKTAGVDGARLRDWVARVGWERLLNRSGTTFRKLPEADKAGIEAERAVAIMLAHPSAIRRPVVEAGDRLLVGFDAASYAEALAGVGLAGSGANG